MNTDRKNLALGGLVGALLAALGLMAHESNRDQAPSPHPATAPVVVPACSPSTCNGSCSRPAPARPFGVVCPYCRNPMTVVPPATGATGKVVGEVRKP